jgi:chromosome segregation ATPase
MADIAKAVEAVAEEAHEAAAEAAEAAIDAAEARAEAAEEARDLLAEAALRDEIGGLVHALRTEFETCRASHERTMTEMQSRHASLQADHQALRSEISNPPPLLVVPSSTSPASPVAGAEAEAEAIPGAVIIPASAEAANVVAAPIGRRRAGRFL